VSAEGTSSWSVVCRFSFPSDRRVDGVEEVSDVDRDDLKRAQLARVGTHIAQNVCGIHRDLKLACGSGGKRGLSGKCSG
jgi:hypothetical protein